MPPSNPNQYTRGELISLEGRAIALQRSKSYQDAARLWETIIEADPEWEHGLAHFSLAGCYERLGEIVKSKEQYLEALRDELHPLYLGGLASLLYLHGGAEEAFETYLQYLQLEAFNHASAELIREVAPALWALGERLGLSRVAIDDRIAKAVEAGRLGVRPPISFVV